MDFAYHYTEEQERFRREVRAWLDDNVPLELGRSAGFAGPGQDLGEQQRDLQRRLGERGWLAPTVSVEWGGAGLTKDHALVLREELRRRGLEGLLAQTATALPAALLRWGTEEQRRRFASAISRGQAALWRLLVEPGAELDTSTLGIQAFRDGDDYVLDGEGVFVGQGARPDYLWTLALTSRDAPPERSTATFLVPAGLEGISIRTPQALVSGEFHQVTFDHVWVPAYCLLGTEGEGWSVLQATLEAEPEYPPLEDEEVEALLQYARKTMRDGEALGKEPVLQQLLVEAYLNAMVARLFRIRNAWMASTDQKLTYHGAQVALWEKQTALRLSQIVREVMGVYALLDPADPRAPAGGRLEAQQRRSLAAQNPTGGPDVQASAVGNALGLGEQRRSQSPSPFAAPAD